MESYNNENKIILIQNLEEYKCIENLRKFMYSGVEWLGGTNDGIIISSLWWFWK